MRIGPIIAAVVLSGAGYGAWVWTRTQPETPAAAARPAGKGKRFALGEGPVPVSVSPVKVAGVPVHREGIGNVQALAAVTVRAQVDGKLLSVEFKEGQEVKKGDVLARIDPVQYQAQLDQALAKKAQDEANLANARLDLDRARKLTALSAGARKTEDTALAQVKQLEAQVRSDDAAIDNARAILGYTTITSPMDGRAGLRQVDPGNLLRSDSSGIVSIMQVAPISVVFTLPQRDLGAVSAALARGKAPVEILSSDGKVVVASGDLQTIDNQVDQATGTIKLKAVFPNADRKLWPGQFVGVRVTVDQLQDAKVVPMAAIRRGPQGPFVYAVAEGKAVVKPVTLALESETEAVVASGIDAGTLVVTLGFARLTDGKAVSVSDPAATPGKSGGERSRGRKRDGQEPPPDVPGSPRTSEDAPRAAPDGEHRNRRAGTGSGGAPDTPWEGKRKREGGPRQQEAGVPESGAGARP